MRVLALHVQSQMACVVHSHSNIKKLKIELNASPSIYCYAAFLLLMLLHL